MIDQVTVVAAKRCVNNACTVPTVVLNVESYASFSHSRAALPTTLHRANWPNDRLPTCQRDRKRVRDRQECLCVLPEALESYLWCLNEDYNEFMTNPLKMITNMWKTLCIVFLLYLCKKKGFYLFIYFLIDLLFPTCLDTFAVFPALYAPTN